MAPMAFPIFKLAALAIRQISKPLANRIKQKAKESLFFRTYICMPPAQLYHKGEVIIKRRLLNIGKTNKPVPKLNEAAAIEQGAEMLGEIFVYTTGAIIFLLEYNRQNQKSAKVAEELEQRWQTVESKIKELELVNDQQAAEIRSLTRFAHASAPKLKLKYEAPVIDQEKKPENQEKNDKNAKKDSGSK